MSLSGHEQTTLLIAGMHDNACRERVVTAIQGVPGVVDAEVSLYRAQATVTHLPRCEPADLVAAVVRAGFDAKLAERVVRLLN